jgi:hypothetical protein
MKNHLHITEAQFGSGSAGLVIKNISALFLKQFELFNNPIMFTLQLFIASDHISQFAELTTYRPARAGRASALIRLFPLNLALLLFKINKESISPCLPNKGTDRIRPQLSHHNSQY